MNKIILATERLYLQTSDKSISKDVLNYYIKNRKHLSPWQDKQPETFYTLNYQRNKLRIEKRNFREGKSIDFYLIEKKENALIGKIAVFDIMLGNFSNCIIGYSLDVDHVGKGYMAEALKCVEKFLFEELNFHRIEINIIPRNVRSINVAKRLDYKYEGDATEIIRVNGVWENHSRFAKINPNYFE